MNRLKLVILLTFVFAIQLNAQKVEHLCVGEQYTFGADSNNVNIFTSHFKWSVSDILLATIDTTFTNNNHQVLIDLNNTGVVMLKVEEIDGNGCSGYDSILVEIHALPNPNIFALGPISFCEGDSVRLQVDSVYSSSIWHSSSIWNDGSLALSILVDTTGWHYIEVTDTNGCIGISDSTFTMQHPNPDVDFSINGICENMPSIFADLSTMPSDTISDRIWYLGNGIIVHGDSVMHIYNDDGDFLVKLIVISDFGCLDSLSRIISIYTQPTADFIFNPSTISTLQPEVNFTNTSYNAMPILWDFDDGKDTIIENPIHIFDDPGIYNVVLTVSDTNQCIDSISKKIIMYYDFVLYMPNSFSPTSAIQENTVFKPKGMRMKKYQSYQFIIYDNWGGTVFETDNINQGWNGKNAMGGSYAWIVIIKDELGKVRKKSGSVVLIR